MRQVEIPSIRCDVDSIRSFFRDGKSINGITWNPDCFSFDDDNGCSVVCSIVKADEHEHRYIFRYNTNHGYHYVVPETQGEVDFLGRIVARYCLLPNVDEIVSNTIKSYQDICLNNQ
jgi:hypothetical protein